MSQTAEKPGTEARPGLSEVTPLAVAPERSHKAQARAMRRARTRRLVLKLALFIGVPTLAAGIYYGALATNQYESYAIFTVQSSELRPTLGVEGLLAGLAPTSGSHDALAVRDYVLSRDMLGRLDREHAFIAHFKDRKTDWLSRLLGDSSFEDAYEYFGHKVFAEYDQVSGAVTIHVRAFSPTKAQEFSQSILAYSEEMVNKLSERERHDRTAYAEADVKKAEDRLTKARAVIVDLQQKHGDFSPLETATATIEVRTQLEGELAKARAELMQLKSFMKDDAPQVQAAAEKVRSISAQVAGESLRLVDPSKPRGLNTKLADFEGAMVEKEFAQKAYESAMANLEMARADADRQHRYLAVVASPSKPDESTYPHRLRSVLTALALSFLLFGIVSLLTASVREHARL